MNRWNRVDLMVAVAAMAALCGCASAPAPQRTTDMRQGGGRDISLLSSELATTRNAWTKCVQAAIPRLDHPESPSAVVARAAMNSCSDEYTNMTGALTRSLAPTCGRDAACTRNALAKAQREATQAATHDVVTERVRAAGAQVLKCQ